jgi:hypothetical protein
MEGALGRTAERAWNAARVQGTCIKRLPRKEGCRQYPEKNNRWACFAVVAHLKGECESQGGANLVKTKEKIHALIEAGKAAEGEAE